MCDVFQLLKYFDNFYNFTSHFIKSFLEKHQFCQHYIQLLDARRVDFVPNWKLGFLEQSPLFWHQAVGYSVGKIDVFWKIFDKVRGKIEKIITISYHLNSISTCN